MVNMRAAAIFCLCCPPVTHASIYYEVVDDLDSMTHRRGWYLLPSLPEGEWEGARIDLAV